MPEIIPQSELIINTDGSIYHLNLLPDDIATDIITVGDPDRVDTVAKRLDEIYLTKHKREFKTVTGRVGGKDVTIISTGIGTDNIDIVFTELDILANVDLATRVKKEVHTMLNFYRIGTSGALREDIAVDSTIISAKAIGLEGLMHYYKYEEREDEKDIAEQAHRALRLGVPNITPYVTSADSELVAKYTNLGRPGITVTATGFYGPQGRKVLAAPRHANFLDNMAMIKNQELILKEVGVKIVILSKAKQSRNCHSERSETKSKKGNVPISLNFECSLRNREILRFRNKWISRLRSKL